MKSFTVVLLTFFLLLSCSNFGQLTYVTKLPKKLDENSGIVYYSDSTAWFIEDNGNPDEIYQVDFLGNLLKEVEVKNAKNGDWEDLAKDENGNLYIGDFGNNVNNRKDLVIYKLPNPQNESGDKIKAEQIRFNYPEQTEFPPEREKLFYDAEAFFYHSEFLYIITKNRANPFPGDALLYKVPAHEGKFNAEYIGNFKTCEDWETCQITAADISPDGKTIVLLSYGKLWVIENFTFDDFSKGKIKEIDLGVRTQLESVCFLDKNTLLLSDEKRMNTGGNLYSFKMPK
jgi:hypothetical protein